jgi:branched-subunit amino acid transport protein
MWLAIILTAVGCYLLKLVGLSVPDKILDQPYVQRLAALLPVALLGALVAVQALSSGAQLQADARLAGVAVGVMALVARAPFLVVVLAAAGTTAVLRALT